MADQNNTPECIKALVDKLRAEASRGPLSSREIFSLTDPIMDVLARADRAAPEGRVRVANRSDGGFSDPTPPPAAPTDNTALVEALQRIAESGSHSMSGDGHAYCVEEALNAIASREAPPAAQEPVVTEAAQVIQTQGVEMTASAMILHIAEVLRENGGAVLSAKPGNDFGSQVLEFAAALRALKGGEA